MAIDTDEFVRAYLECALWTDSISEDDDRSIQEEYTPDQLLAESRAQAEEDCRLFIAANTDLLNKAVALYSMSERGQQWSVSDLAGHDFWLTRNHHGTGFWDRGLGPIGEDLTKSAQQHPERSVLVTANGTLEIL